MPFDTTGFIFQHVFLPPQLPQTDHKEGGADGLLRELWRAAREFCRSLRCSDSEAYVWQQLSRSISKWIDIYDDGVSCSSKIVHHLQDMHEEDVLLFYLKPQNAAIVVRNRSTGAIFECFEVLPKTKEVLNTKDALLRQFPARGVFVPEEVLADTAFMEQLGDAIQRLSMEEIEMAMEKTQKADNTVVEPRQSAHPRAVTELLFGILSSHGRATSSPTITKRTHDDVLWTNGNPWRRSGVWLSARVALHIALLNSELGDDNRAQYKNFMLFLLSQLAVEISTSDKSPDVLHVLRVKLARRNAKLGQATLGFVQSAVQTAIRQLDEIMQAHRREIIDRDNRRIPAVPLQEASSQLTMRKSRATVHTVWARSRQPFRYPLVEFTPPLDDRTEWLDEELPSEELFNDSGTTLFTLVEFEVWVDKHLEDWRRLRGEQPASCHDLKELMQKYYQCAKEKYGRHPERISIMFLTIFELWVALDKVATALCPILLQYPPELDAGLFSPLLLHKRAELERLSRIEVYISSRASGSKASSPSLFSDPCPNCFAVQVFNTSTELQSLRGTIEAEARGIRKSKAREWKSMDDEFKAIMKSISKRDCDKFIPRWTGVPRHDKKCTKCEAEQRAMNMQITKHEWPLPEDEFSAKAIIFELNPPRPILSWRDATWFLVQDIGRSNVCHGLPIAEVLVESEPLASFLYWRDRRVTLASAVKPMYKAHYFKSGLNMDHLFVKNGLIPLTHDTKAKTIWTAEQTTTPSLSRYCSSRLGGMMSEHLGPQVNKTAHSQNSVIAKQSACPSEMSPHEFLLFGSMRAGARLQWMNVLATLMSSEFDLNSPNAALLFLHTTSQVGNSGDTDSNFLRESQVELTEESFCQSLLNALEVNFERIEANWKETTAADVVLMVTLKVLSLTSHTECHARSMALVLQIRQAGVKWIRLLAHQHSQQKTDLTGTQALDDISRQLVKICLLTKHTFDVDEDLRPLAFENRTAVADYIEACIHLRDHREQACSNGESKQAASLLNDDYHSRLWEKYLLDALNNDNGAFSEGVKRCWSSATFTAHWEIVSKDDTSWLMNKASSTVVHYNLVTGSLLVAGQPVSRLPTSYTSNALYRSVLGHMDLDVFAVDIDGMEYMSRVTFEGHQLYFGMRGQELLIRSQKSDQVYEAILGTKFLGDLPNSIVKNAVPWMSLHDGRVTFRQRDQRWLSDQNDWILFPDFHPRTSITMHTNKAFLIDKHSAVGRAICDILRPFEHEDHIVITKHDNIEIKINLPRYHLNFFVTFKGEVQCKELAAVIDSNQTIGTLYGLQNRLVLRAAKSLSGSPPRSVLIPNGMPRISAASPHVKVEVSLGKEDNLTFSNYQIDERLGQLNSDSLEGHLFKAYLHAITSFPEYDSLTGRTGTDECLFSLSDPIVLTCTPMSNRSRSLLHAISQLSPRRTFYPRGINTMQTVVFHKSLSWFSQRDIFFGTANEIVTHNLKTSFLFDDKDTTAISYEGNLELLQRSHQRSSKLYPCHMLDDSQISQADCWYVSRDQCFSRNQIAATSLAALIGTWPSSFDVQAGLKAMILQWGDISGFHEEFTVSSVSRLLREDFKTQFASLFSYCKSSACSAASLTFILPFLAFGQPEILPQLKTLLAFAVSPHLNALPNFDSNVYNLKNGYAFDENDISKIMSVCEFGFQPIGVSNRTASGGQDSFLKEREAFDHELKDQGEEILEAVRSSWPAGTVRLPPEADLDHYNYEKLTTLLNARFGSWYQNFVFLSQLDACDVELGKFHSSSLGPEKTIDTILPFSHNPARPAQNIQFCVLELLQLVQTPERDFDKRKPSQLDQDLTKSVAGKECHKLRDANELRCALEELEDITEDLGQNSRAIVRNYGVFLKESIKASKLKAEKEEPRLTPPKTSLLTLKGKEVKKSVDYILARTRALLQPSLDSHQALVKARLWPQISQLILLQLLSSEYRDQVPSGWLKILIWFAEEITALQRIERLQKYLVAGDRFALQRELANPAHADWSTEQHPDWLLLEIQNNMLIRPVQIRVAQELIKPENGVLLLGMGEGKTSVILPMVIMALATGKLLVRVVILKPLATEMLRLLSKSLSGLCGRSVYYLPFSRQTPLNDKTPRLLMNLYKECRKNAGVLLALPEYLNSFRLASADLLGGETNGLATKLMQVQQWLDCKARDVLDESDELLKPGYELVYTNGEAAVLSGAPDRWIVALEILALIQLHAVELHERSPAGIELEHRGRDCFPHFRVIGDEGALMLSHFLIDQILSSRLPGLPLGHCNPRTLQALRSFLNDREVDPAQFQLISHHFRGSAQLDTLYVVRGLLSHEILVHCLRKRWLVNYGLDRSRCLAAVPYRAKAVPSPSAEFAQPETLIILTALSCFYTGLERHDMRRCILMLLRTSDPGEEYSKWVVGSSLPSQYRNAGSLNLDDASCVEQVFAHLRNNRALIDFFLRQVVYPKEAKEFRHKLSSSAWDLCSTEGGKVTSGFSGTCDSQIPTTCVQKDLGDLRHATASTLATLLRHDNRDYVLAATATGQRLSTDGLLQLVVEQPISPDVIIDVGALFLEENREIASRWLDLCPSKEAAIFFNANDEKMILNRDGTTEPFASSMCKDKVSACLIYLDEFHTRGTDFQLPDDFKAAVLLGPGILKDSLAQACMRMRKLAFSQSVRFFAPPEVDTSIRAFVKDPLEKIDSSHVIRWSIAQSCQALESQQPVWAMKGMTHARRRLALARLQQSNGSMVNCEAYLDAIREQESRPVSEMYPAGTDIQKRLQFEPTDEEMDDPIMRDLVAEWHLTDMRNFQDQLNSEEQEREVLHEVEHEREVQRPLFATPAEPQESDFLRRLLQYGEINDHTEDLFPAFDTLNHTRLASTYDAAKWPNYLLVTQDFMKTIETVHQSTQDDFLRPAEFILKVTCVEQPILISPHEAQIFVPYLRQFRRGRLFLYQPRTGKHMAPFDGLQVYQVPETSEPIPFLPATITTLNLFAGQLYFTTFEDYKRLCELIGLWDGERELPNNRLVGNDNFVSPACRTANGWTSNCHFDTSPVKMLREFIGMRRLGQEWRHTHLGRVLEGRLLRREEFEEALPASIALSASHEITDQEAIGEITVKETVDEITDKEASHESTDQEAIDKIEDQEAIDKIEDKEAIHKIPHEKTDTDDKGIGKDAEGNWFEDRCALS